MIGESESPVEADSAVSERTSTSAFRALSYTVPVMRMEAE